MIVTFPSPEPTWTGLGRLVSSLALSPCWLLSITQTLEDSEGLELDDGNLGMLVVDVLRQCF